MATIDIALESTSQQILNKLSNSGDTSELLETLQSLHGGIQDFSSPGTYTFLVPAGVKYLQITACGAGGGGSGGCYNASGTGGNHNAYSGGGGGGGGAGNASYCAVGGRGGNGYVRIEWGMYADQNF